MTNIPKGFEKVPRQRQTWVNENFTRPGWLPSDQRVSCTLTYQYRKGWYTKLGVYWDSGSLFVFVKDQFWPTPEEAIQALKSHVSLKFDTITSHLNAMG